MFKYTLLCILLGHSIWAKPIHPHHSELAPHVLIVTPQAQLRLESLVPGAPLIQHLSPFTRYITPHEETIVYVPASAAAALQNAEIVARSLEGNKGKQLNPSELASSLGTLASSGAQSIQSAAQSAAESASSYLTSSTTFVPTLGTGQNLQSGAEAFLQGAQSAINSFAQAQAQAQSQTQQAQIQPQLLSAESPFIATEVALPPIIAEQKLPVLSTAFSLPPAASADQKLPVVALGTKMSSLSSLLQPILPSISIYTNEPRHHYVVAPAAPHVLDFVPGSILLSPAATTTIKARRSILAEEKDKDDKPQPAPASSPSLYASNNDLEKAELLLKEKKEEFKRFLEANALKEEIKEEPAAPNSAEDIRLLAKEKDEKIILEKNPNELKLAPEAAKQNEGEASAVKAA